ncbi:MAG: hypothetical protein R3B54_12105 [Bdellovibrionota bacterium]
MKQQLRLRDLMKITFFVGTLVLAHWSEASDFSVQQQIVGANQFFGHNVAQNGRRFSNQQRPNGNGMGPGSGMGFGNGMGPGGGMGMGGPGGQHPPRLSAEEEQVFQSCLAENNITLPPRPDANSGFQAAQQTCHQQAQGDRDAMDTCMQNAGFARPEPPSDENREVIRACHERASGNRQPQSLAPVSLSLGQQASLVSCLQTQGVTVNGSGVSANNVDVITALETCKAQILGQ